MLNDGFTELEDVLLGLELDEAYGAGVRRGPGKEVGMAGDKRRKEMKITEDQLPIAVDDDVAVTESQVSEELAGSATADGGVVLEIGARFEDLGITGGEPAKTQAGETVGFADRVETYGAVVEIAGSGEERGRIVLQLAVHFVGENIDAAFGSKVKNTFEYF